MCNFFCVSFAGGWKHYWQGEFDFYIYLPVNMKVDSYSISHCGLFTEFVCGCAVLQKGESVKKMREEVGSPEEIFNGILSVILSTSPVANLV